MPLYRSLSSSVPVANSSTAATAGTSGNLARSDHAHPRYNWDATDQGFLAWTYDPIACSSDDQRTTGVLTVAKINIPVACTITTITCRISVGGSSFTSGQSFLALYDTSKNLLSATADQSAVWTSAGVKTANLAVAQAVAAGTYWVAYWAVATTMPKFTTGGSNAGGSINANLSAANSRAATTSDTGLTTTAPSAIGTMSALSTVPWFALS